MFLSSESTTVTQDTSTATTTAATPTEQTETVETTEQATTATTAEIQNEQPADSEDEHRWPYCFVINPRELTAHSCAKIYLQ